MYIFLLQSFGSLTRQVFSYNCSTCRCLLYSYLVFSFLCSVAELATSIIGEKDEFVVISPCNILSCCMLQRLQLDCAVISKIKVPYNYSITILLHCCCQRRIFSSPEFTFLHNCTSWKLFCFINVSSHYLVFTWFVPLWMINFCRVIACRMPYLEPFNVLNSLRVSFSQNVDMQAALKFATGADSLQLWWRCYTATQCVCFRGIPLSTALCVRFLTKQMLKSNKYDKSYSQNNKFCNKGNYAGNIVFKSKIVLMEK